MTALANPKPAPRSVSETIAPEQIRTQHEADRETLVGPELNIRLSLSPRVLLMAASPLAVGVSMLVGWVVLTSLAMPVYAREMLAAAIVAIVGGTFAALPLLMWMKKGALAIAQCGLLGIAIRCTTILGGLILAFGPGWNLDKTALVYWTLGFYFPLLIAETTMIAWLAQRAKI